MTERSTRQLFVKLLDPESPLTILSYANLDQKRVHPSASAKTTAEHLRNAH